MSHPHSNSQIRRKVSFDDKPSTGRLEPAVKLVSGRAQEYEYQLRAVESELSTTLSNFRAIDSIMREAYAGIEQHTLRANHALDVQAPYIAQELEDSEKSLTQLTERLPAVDTQVANIKSIYDTGRDEAQRLVDDLTWLNTDFYERWRRIIFTSSSPVSWRWKAVMRTLFAISFVICTVLFWIALSGAYRAHRHRLVWGDKLMS